MNGFSVRSNEETCDCLLVVLEPAWPPSTEQEAAFIPITDAFGQEDP